MLAKLNPDTEFAKETKTLIKKNGGFCISAGIKCKDTKCMCKEFKAQMEKGIPGFCMCGLYYIPEQKEE